MSTPAAAHSSASTKLTAAAAPQVAAEVSRSREPSRALEPEADDVDDGINLSTLFERCNISPMQEKVFSFSPAKLFSTCWLHGKGYG